MSKGYRIFTGANGYYVACEGDDGFHHQPADNGARLGWDREAAERELQQVMAEDDELWPDEEV